MRAYCSQPLPRLACQRLLGFTLLALSLAWLGGNEVQAAASNPAPAAPAQAVLATASPASTPVSAPASTARTAPAASTPIPVEVQADTLQHDESKKQSLFRGNVVVTRGATRILCDELLMTRDAMDNVMGQARGLKRDVQVTSRSEAGADIVAHGKTLDFNTGTETGVLRGDAFFQQTSADGAVNTIKGEVVNFNWNSQGFDAVGSSGGRVQLKFVPKPQ